MNSACSPVAEADDDSSDEDDSENFSNDYDDGSQKVLISRSVWLDDAMCFTAYSGFYLYLYP